MVETRVYQNTPEYKDYQTARWSEGDNHISFPWRGHRWQYGYTSFSDDGNYDLLWRPSDTNPVMRFEDFLGKTVSGVDTTCSNCVIITFTDGTKANLFAECSSDGIPFFEFYDTVEN